MGPTELLSREGGNFMLNSRDTAVPKASTATPGTDHPSSQQEPWPLEDGAQSLPRPAEACSPAPAKLSFMFSDTGKAFTNTPIQFQFLGQTHRQRIFQNGGFRDNAI